MFFNELFFTLLVLRKWVWDTLRPQTFLEAVTNLKGTWLLMVYTRSTKQRDWFDTCQNWWPIKCGLSVFNSYTHLYVYAWCMLSLAFTKSSKAVVDKSHQILTCRCVVFNIKTPYIMSSMTTFILKPNVWEAVSSKCSTFKCLVFFSVLQFNYK